MLRRDTPVLIIGAGPAGLTAAATLARYGVESLTVERRAERLMHPRATSISTRTMELLRSFEIEDKARAGGVEGDWLLVLCETLTKADQGMVLELGMPTRDQAKLISPTAPAIIGQDHFEVTLHDYNRQLDVGSIEMGWEVVSVTNSGDGVIAQVKTVDGEEVEIHAQYAIVADGVYSQTRDQLGFGSSNTNFLLAGVHVLIHAPLWDLIDGLRGEPRYALYNAHTNDESTQSYFLAAGPNDRWLGGYHAPASATPPPVPSDEELKKRFRTAIGQPDFPIEIQAKGSWTSPTAVADRFRIGNAFLVGDAAHRVTPRGGTGLNSSVHDAYDLGWKLAWVLKGWVAAEYLDLYDIERRPVAEHNLLRSTDEHGSFRGPETEMLRADIGGRIGHHWVETSDGAQPGTAEAGHWLHESDIPQLSTLDLIGEGLTVISGPDDGQWRSAVSEQSSSIPVSAQSVDSLTARALGVRPGGALIVRTDGVPLAHVPAPDQLTQALGMALSVPREGTALSVTGKAAGN